MMDINKNFQWQRFPKVEQFFLDALGEIKKQNSSIADFEEKLQRLNKILTPPVVARLREIPFLRSSKGGISAPKDLYLKTRLNYICLGDEVPYVQGSRGALYKLLRCKDIPEAYSHF